MGTTTLTLRITGTAQEILRKHIKTRYYSHVISMFVKTNFEDWVKENSFLLENMAIEDTDIVAENEIRKENPNSTKATNEKPQRKESDIQTNLPNQESDKNLNPKSALELLQQKKNDKKALRVTIKGNQSAKF